MLLHKVSLIVLITVGLASQANEHKAPEHGKEPEKGAEGEGGSATKSQKQFAEMTSKLTTLENRIIENNKKFEEMVHHKAESKSPQEKQALIKEMNELAKERNKDVDAYNKLRMDVLYRFPNQGEPAKRRYKTQSRKSTEELEAGAAGLDEMLTRMKKVIEKKYAPLIPVDPKAEPVSAQQDAEEEQKPKRLRLEK